jgi:hypothetical protein
MLSVFVINRPPQAPTIISERDLVASHLQVHAHGPANAKHEGECGQGASNNQD